MAARTNSSWAPRGPRSRSRPSLRMRFKCANRISIFLRSRRDCSKASVPANDRATSRACSWMSRGTLRDGSFGQHCGLSGHRSQSSLLARYRSVLPSCTVPLSGRHILVLSSSHFDPQMTSRAASAEFGKGSSWRPFFRPSSLNSRLECSNSSRLESVGGRMWRTDLFLSL